MVSEHFEVASLNFRISLAQAIELAYRTRPLDATVREPSLMALSLYDGERKRGIGDRHTQ